MKTILTIILIALCVSVAGQIKEPLRHYSFDDAGAATGLEDSSGNGATLKMYGNPTFSSTVKAAGSQSALFDGNGDYFRIPITNHGNEFFISFWVLTDASIITTQTMFSKAGANSYGGVANATNNIYAQSYISSFNVTSSVSSWSGSVWHHVVYYFDDNSTNTKVRIWVDGSKLTLADSLIATGIATNDSIYIGANMAKGSVWIGYIDEFRLYSGYAPSESQIDSLYQKTYIGTVGGGTAYNPISGRHMRFYANGVEKKDKGRDGTFQYWLAKKQAPTTYTRIDIAQNVSFVLSGAAQDYDWVGEVHGSRSWRMDEGNGAIYYTYNINEDTSGLFGISSNVIYCKDISRMQSSKRYKITYAVYDGLYYDVANIYIYKPPADSCVTVTNWQTYDGNFTTGYYYFQSRGTELPITQKIDINVNDVYIGAVGVGNKPVLNKLWQNDGANNYMHGLFHSLSKSGITIQSIYFDPNGYGSSNPYYSCAIFMSGCLNIKIDNCDIIGDMAGELMDLWGYPARLEATGNVTYTNNVISGVLYDGLYNTGSTGGLIENNYVTYVNNVVDMPTWNYGTFGGGDIFFLRTTTSGGSFNVRHNYGDKSNNTCKSMIVLKRAGSSLPGSDTIEFNYFKGYSHTGEIAHTYEGVTGLNFSGVSNSIIRYNIFEDCSRVLFTYSEDVGIGDTVINCNGSANNKFYYNLCINSYILPITLTDASTGTQIYNNTFAGYGTAWFAGWSNVKGFYHGPFNTNIVNNIIYQSGVNPYYSTPTGTVDFNLYLYRGLHPLNANELEANPLFNTDYSLQSGSPAINAGTTTISGGLGIDVSRVPVPQNTLYDIGTKEKKP